MKNKDFWLMLIAFFVVTASTAIFIGIKFGWAMALVVLILGFVISIIFGVFTKKRYKDLESLNSYLEQVLAGNDMPGILDQQEGELSILKNNIYKTTMTLRHQKKLLSEDKVRMATALSDISHQLKTPLTSMMVMNDLLKVEESREKRDEFLQTQSDQLDRMNWLIQTLLKLSKLDAGTIELKKEQVGDAELITEVMKPFAVLMELKNIQCIVNTINTTMNCDKNWTVEAIQNIVKNCIEHMADGGKLEISFEDTTIYKQISIKDNGCGIAAEDLPHIFERFYKGKNSGKDSVGIGLALSKTILNNQHGEIIVDSEEQVGTTFFVRFYKTII